MLIVLFGGFALVLLVAATMLGVATGYKLMGSSTSILPTPSPVLVPGTPSTVPEPEVAQEPVAEERAPGAVESEGGADPASDPEPSPAVPEPAPSSVPVPAPAPAAPAAAPTGATFVSLLPDTRKISVRCDSGAGRGIDEAVVQGEAHGRCTVTVVDARRQRRTAVVQEVEPRRYECFAAGGDDCH